MGNYVHRFHCIMPSLSDIISNGIINKQNVLGLSVCDVCLSVHSFLRTDVVTTVSHEWLEQSR